MKLLAGILAILLLAACGAPAATQTPVAPTATKAPTNTAIPTSTKAPTATPASINTTAPTPTKVPSNTPPLAATKAPTAVPASTPTPEPTKAPPTATAIPTPTKASASACLPVPAWFVKVVQDSLTVGGGGTLAGTSAFKVKVGDSDSAQWYLVAARIKGEGMGDNYGVWVTTSNITATEITYGTVYSADSMAAEFSKWPRPAAVKDRFPSTSDPDIQKVLACAKAAAR